MVMDKEDTADTGMMVDMVVVVMITTEVTEDTADIMTTPVMETMVNTLSMPTITHKRVIIISKTNNSKNFINFFCRINQIVFCGNEDVRN